MKERKKEKKKERKKESKKERKKKSDMVKYDCVKKGFKF